LVVVIQIGSVTYFALNWFWHLFYLRFMQQISLKVFFSYIYMPFPCYSALLLARLLLVPASSKRSRSHQRWYMLQKLFSSDAEDILQCGGRFDIQRQNK